MITLEFVIKHIRDDWGYMKGISRGKTRVRSTGEVFTPTKLVLEYIDYCESQYPDAFSSLDSTFGDNSCGDGQFLGEILIRKLERLNKSSITDEEFKTALSSLFGVDYQESNIMLCRHRLLCKQEQFRSIVTNNIVEADSLRYHYRFDGSPPYDPPPEKPVSAKIERKKKLQQMGILALSKEDQNRITLQQLGILK